MIIVSSTIVDTSAGELVAELVPLLMIAGIAVGGESAKLKESDMSTIVLRTCTETIGASAREAYASTADLNLCFGDILGTINTGR